MYDIEECEVIVADCPGALKRDIDSFLSKGYVILPNSLCSEKPEWIYTVLMGKPRTTSIKEL